MDVWAEFRQHFDTDDGSLPGVCLSGLVADQVVSLCQHLRETGGETLSGDFAPRFWDTRAQQDRLVESVPDAARLVVNDAAEPFHAVLKNIRVRGKTVPDLGVFVSRDQLCLDYRMGAAWDADSVTAFLELLRGLLRRAPGAHLEFEETFAQPRPFLRSWAEYLETTAPH